MEEFRMGKDMRSGYGYGMNLSEARDSFYHLLNRAYGEDLYCGGGNDIRQWLKEQCIEKPVLASSPTRVTSVKTNPKADGKLVNGFIVTTNTPELSRKQFFAQSSNVPVPEAVEHYVLTQIEAKKDAAELAKKYNTKVHITPARLWQDEWTKRLSLPTNIYEVNPSGAQEAKPGKWFFEVEVAI